MTHYHVCNQYIERIRSDNIGGYRLLYTFNEICNQYMLAVQNITIWGNSCVGTKLLNSQKIHLSI